MSGLRAALPAALAILAGCAVTSPDGERLALGSPEFQAYAEKVFREQNRVATELAFAVEQTQGEAPTDLTAAEDDLLASCAGVNELATLRRDGETTPVFRSVRNARSVPRCEVATEVAKAALDKAPD